MNTVVGYLWVLGILLVIGLVARAIVGCLVDWRVRTRKPRDPNRPRWLLMAAWAALIAMWVRIYRDRHRL